MLVGSFKQVAGGADLAPPDLIPSKNALPVDPILFIRRSVLGEPSFQSPRVVKNWYRISEYNSTKNTVVRLQLISWRATPVHFLLQ